MLRFILEADAFKQVNEEGELFLPKGDYTVYVGGSVPSERSTELGASEEVSGTISSKKLKKL